MLKSVKLIGRLMRDLRKKQINLIYLPSISSGLSGSSKGRHDDKAVFINGEVKEVANSAKS